VPINNRRIKRAGTGIQSPGSVYVTVTAGGLRSPATSGTRGPAGRKG